MNLTSQPSAADPARNSSSDLRVILTSKETGAECWRGMFSDFARDNADAFTLEEIRQVADLLAADRRVPVNMGAGGVFVLSGEPAGTGSLLDLLRAATLAQDVEAKAKALETLRTAIDRSPVEVPEWIRRFAQSAGRAEVVDVARELLAALNAVLNCGRCDMPDELFVQVRRAIAKAGGVL